MVNICALNDGRNHTVYLMKKDGTGANIAMGMGPKGEGFLQFKDTKGEVRFIDLEKVAKLIE
jgi:hypothetical protein